MLGLIAGIERHFFQLATAVNNCVGLAKWEQVETASAEDVARRMARPSGSFPVQVLFTS